MRVPVYSFSWFRQWFALVLCGLLSTQAWGDDTWPRTLQSPYGPVTLDHPPTRIVSTSVTLTGSLLALDAPVVASGAASPNARFTDSQGFLRQWSDVARARQLQRLYVGEPNAEAIALQMPDLIVVSATGHDSALRLRAQLSSIAPTLVINYDDQSWQDVTRQLARATGKEANAEQLIDRFNQRVIALKARLKRPEHPVSAFVYANQGQNVHVWTPESPQGQLLQQLGFTLAATPAAAQRGTMGKRKDIVTFSGEALAQGLTGDTFLLFAGDDDTAQQVMQDRFLAHLPAVKAHRVYALGVDSFRLDYYSAREIVERLAQRFGIAAS